MAEPYVTVSEVEVFYRKLSADEYERCCALLKLLSDDLRWKAHQCGKDLDTMITNGLPLGVVKEVLISAAIRVMRQDNTGEPMTQVTQSALGYSVSGTYAIPGGGIGTAFLRSDYKRLGLNKQRIGVIDFYDPRNDSTSVG